MVSINTTFFFSNLISTCVLYHMYFPHFSSLFYHFLSADINNISSAFLLSQDFPLFVYTAIPSQYEY